MTIGTLIIIILGLAYVVWSYYAVNELIFGGDILKRHTALWIGITMAGAVALIVSLVVPYLYTNWNTNLF